MSAISRVIRATITVAVVVAGFTSTPSEAQWAWKDGNGRLVYSDRPPPSDVKPASIVRQPTQQMLPNPLVGSVDDASKPSDAKSPDAKGAPNAPKTIAERDMEFRKRQQCAHHENRCRRQPRIPGRRAAGRRSRSHAQDYSKHLQLGLDVSFAP